MKKLTVNVLFYYYQFNYNAKFNLFSAGSPVLKSPIRSESQLVFASQQQQPNTASSQCLTIPASVGETSIRQDNIDTVNKSATSSAASLLFDKLKASTDVNPQRLSPLKEDKKSEMSPVLSSSLCDKKALSKSLSLDDPSTQDSKEDNEYWSAKDVNIESVIQKLCSEDDTGPDTPKSDTGVEITKTKPSENEQKSPVQVNQEEKPTSQVEEHDESDLTDNEVTGKVKIKIGLKRKDTVSENENKTIILEKQLDLSAQGLISEEVGVQTRNSRSTTGTATVTTATQQSNKRGNSRSNRVKSAPVCANSQSCTKQKNQCPESDVYEFHDDSSDDAIGKETVEKPKLVNIGKNSPPSTSTPQTTPPPMTIVSTISMSNPIPVQEQSSVPILQPSQNQSLTLPITEATTGQDTKEDFALPSTANTRKSRRLQERDGTRSTVDDIIEDVVRNSTSQSPKNSTLRQLTSSSSPIPVISTVSVTQNTPARRSTRQNNNIPNVKMPAIVADKTLFDARKSPRAGSSKKNKDRKLSETSIDSSDEKPKAESSQDSTTVPEPVPLQSHSSQETSITVKVKETESIPILETQPMPQMTSKLNEQPQTPQSSIPSQKLQVPASQITIPPPLQVPSSIPIVANLAVGHNVSRPLTTNIHIAEQQDKQLPPVVPIPVSSVAAAVIQHTPVISTTISQKMSVTQQPTISMMQKPQPFKQHVLSSGSLPSQHMHQIPIDTQKIAHTQQVVKLCGPPSAIHTPSSPSGMATITTINISEGKLQGNKPTTQVHIPSQPNIVHIQQQQLPPGSIITKHGNIQPTVHASGNLVINIPPGSGPQQQQPSPRISTQQHIITKQGTTLSTVQMISKPPLQSPNSAKIIVNQHPSPSVTVNTSQSPMVIHGKQVHVQSAPGGYTTVLQNSKILHQSQGQPPTQIHQGPPSKHYQVQQIQLTSAGISGQHMPQGTIVTQTPIKMHSKQDQHIPNKGSQVVHIVQQQHQSSQNAVPHMLNKSIPIQQTQQVGNVVHGKTIVTHPPQIQGKCSIVSLHQQPQILTGAVASPPLKHSMHSQSPNVTGMQVFML